MVGFGRWVKRKELQLQSIFDATLSGGI